MLQLIGKTLIFSDLHVGNKSDAVSRLNLSILAIEEILKIIVAEKISNVVFLGDWFHSREYVHTTTLTIGYQLMTLLANRCKVVVIAGNHDIQSNAYTEISPLYTFKNIDNTYIFNDITEFFINTKKCLAVPWGYTNYETNNKYDYVFGHLNVAGSAIRYNKVVGDITDNNTYITTSMNDVRTFSQKLKPNGICFSGHIHLKTEHRYRSNKIIFVGSPFELNFGETSAAHGVFILDTQTEFDNVIFKEIENVPKHLLLKLSDCIDNKTKKIKSKDYFKKYNNNIIKKIIDVELTQLQQQELNDILNSLNIYDNVETEISYTVVPADSINTDISSAISVERLTMNSYIDLVFESMPNDVFDQADTDKKELKDIFKTYQNPELN